MDSPHINPKTGFRNYRPVGRKYRQDQANIQRMEKQRIMQRREGFVRSDGIENPVETPQWSAGYASEAERFMLDTVGEEKAERDYKKMLERNRIDKMKQEREERDRDRWLQREEQIRKEEERINQLERKKNDSSVAYNLITKSTNDSKEKELFEYQMKMQEYSGAQRAQRLYRNQNKEQYNPLTGEPLPERIIVPPIPERPSHYDDSQRYRYRQ